jgi:hypothetical protein
VRARGEAAGQATITPNREPKHIASILWELYHRQASLQAKRRAYIMAAQQTTEIGNAIIVLTGVNDPFSDGHTTGYLEFYDERYRSSFPLTSQAVADHLTMIMNEPSVPLLWKAGRIAGWIEALVENSPQTFRSFVAVERITTLQAL